MDIEEVIKWLMIMKANLNSFPEVSSDKKSEALGEAIRLLKNEQSEEPSVSEIPNKSVEEKCPCYDCEYFVIDGLSHCKIYEGAYGDCRCKNYHKVNQDLNKVNQDSNKSEIPTGSVDCISREQALDLLCKKCPVYNCIQKCVSYKAIEKMSSATPIRSKGHWIYDKSFANWICSKCGETPKTIGYVGTGAFMAEHFKYCNHCGAEMEGSEEV